MSNTTMSWLGGGAGLNRAAQTGQGNGGSAGSGHRPGQSPKGVALLQGLAKLGRCGLAGHGAGSSLTVSGRSEEVPDGFADRRIAVA